MEAKIFNYLTTIDEQEQQQRKTGRFTEEFAEEKGALNPRLKIQNHLFAEDRPIVIRKHRRFAPYPLHSHQFLEFNYMLKGTSHQIVNGKSLTLKENQLLLLDTDSCHELAALGEGDLLINFLFRTKDLKIDSLKRIDAESAGMTYDFIMNAVLGPNFHENYLMLDLVEEPEVRLTLEQMITEAFSNRRLASEILNSQSQVLFLQLTRIYQSQIASIYWEATKDDVLISILQRIEDDFASLTLNQLAQDLGYNRNYLSNMVKERTGATFKELLTLERLKNAHSLLLSTGLPIEHIAHYCGFSNKTQFYKKFFQQYNKTPYQVRQKG
ncbi:helix-turn-helix domain-containing protein [Enterococcus sp. 2201sp1_2201st1_B8_2201SCRN_220225]|uniref:helix-turn-helix domain-containing protein n=1 Tax=unclassified Enterococcus TaxID=2608891 RepID=UPI0034A4CEB4